MTILEHLFGKIITQIFGINRIAYVSLGQSLDGFWTKRSVFCSSGGNMLDVVGIIMGDCLGEGQRGHNMTPGYARDAH